MTRAIVYKMTGPPSVLELVKDWRVRPREQGEVRSTLAVLSKSSLGLSVDLRGPTTINATHVV